MSKTKSETDAAIKEMVSNHFKALASKGGIARAASLSPERRREIAMIANRARNKGKTKTKEDE